MGAGSSAAAAATGHAQAHHQAQAKDAGHFAEGAPLGNGGPMSSGERASGSLSDARLRKMALGLPSYKEIHRDYADTLEELDFNHSQQVDWVTPPQGFEKRPEKLVDGPLYGRGAGASGANYPTQDMRAAAAGGRGAHGGGRGGPQIMPANRPRPPAPRRPSNPISVPVPSPATQLATRAQSPSFMHPTEAPSVLPRLKAPLDSAPLMHAPLQSYSEANPYPGNVPSTSSRQQAVPVSSGRVVVSGSANPAPQTPPTKAHVAAGARRGPPNAEEGGEEDELHYNHSDYVHGGRAGATPPRGIAGLKTGKQPGPAAVASSFPDAPKEPPPHLPVRPFPGAVSDKDYDDGDAAASMYATFGVPPLDAGVADPKRPSFVPALRIGSPAAAPGGGGSPGQPYPVYHPAVPQKPSQPLVRPPNSLAPGKPGASAPTPAPSNNAPVVGGQSGGSSSGAVPATIRNTSGDGKATQNAPPKPNTKSPHEVKETKDVKRNRAQLPSQLTHAKPTTGDWLKKRYIVNNYILLDILGAGSYGEVRMCKDRTSDHLYAIKIISKDLLKKKKNGNTSETYFEDIKREIAIMKKLLHPNVLRLFEVLDDPNVNKMYLVLEYMKKGDLINILKGREIKPTEGQQEKDTTRSTAIKSGFTPLSDPELWNIFRQVAAGIRYLHYQNIVHGDIKPQNLLVGEDGVVKIADFGIAKMLHASGQKLADAAGTPAFMAPELFDSGKTFSGQLSDIWAMGATMFMLRFGHPPFVAKSIVKLSDRILNDPLVFPYAIDDVLRDLLENMLLKEPTKRLTLQQVIMHKWMRVPPAAAAATTQRPTTGASGGRNGSGSAATGEGISSRPSFAGIGFIPPPSYDNEEAAAMAVPVTADNEDIFMSIGTRNMPLKRAVSVEEADEEDVEDEELGVEEGGDVMATQWGADVFEMVDDEVNSDSDDEDAGTIGSGSPPSGEKMRRKSRDLGNKGVKSPLYDTETSVTSQQRAEMTAEEEERRAKRFTEKLTKRSLQNVYMDAVDEFADATADFSGSAALQSLQDPPLFRTGPAGRDAYVAPSKDGEQDGVAIGVKADGKAEVKKQTPQQLDGKQIPGPGPPRGPGKAGPLTVSIPPATAAPGSLITSIISSPAGGTPILTPKNKRQPRSPGATGSTSAHAFDDDEDMEQLTMEEFEGLMDTLALQPHRDDGDGAATGPVNVTLKPSSFSAQLRNLDNFVGAAFHSEQGRRDNQEDRCVLLPDVSAMRALESCEPPLTHAVMEQLRRFSIAGVFDGHSGWRCAQYLSQNLVPTLVLHEKFLDKQPDAAVLEVFRSVDDQVCRLLRKENDTSGSTGVLAIYDGRRHVLTVANVGDSMVVLSRGGRAVKLHRMHRVGPDDTAERQRVEMAGGAVLNNRVAGVLAISRAFGDTQFKEPGYCPVTAVPDLCSEVITPMTEFGIVATDGLWDVMAPQDAINFVRKKLSKKADLQECARELVQEAMARGSVDNVTCLLMSFHMESS